jgi:hypothetical protein
MKLQNSAEQLIFFKQSWPKNEWQIVLNEHGRPGVVFQGDKTYFCFIWFGQFRKTYKHLNLAQLACYTISSQPQITPGQKVAERVCAESTLSRIICFQN